MTSLGINQSILSKKFSINLLFRKGKFKYDVCIMDEASQSLETLTLGPILLGEKFILIGDHLQVT